ncbi:MAG: PspC domain-containing protein [Actinomycetota bacterium]|nr:PspC domain-containing protein [Actinomycetota bacterium]
MGRTRTPPGTLTVADIPRSTDDRVIAGVCGGIGARFGVDPMVVRLAAVVLTLANGIGVAAYVAAWAVFPDAGSDGRATSWRVRPQTTERTAGIGLVTLGVLLLMRHIGLLLPSGLVWSITVSAMGFAIVWARTSDAGRARLRDLALGTADEDGRGSTRSFLLRAVLGGTLLITGLALLFASGGVLAAIGQLGLAVLATGIGVGLLMGPWIVGLWRDLDTERRQRIRSEERSEMAAHLHDSVLQTLTLIQRHADAPGRTRMLARRQERELRAWLFDERAPEEGAPSTLAVALEQVITEVEDQHEVEVDLVLVGDADIDRPLEGFVSALREATHNAARHSGAPEVSLYVEVEPDRVSAYVRDRGRGFDPAAVEPGRLGVSGSIIGRMQRLAGKAEVHSTVGEGTEVVLEIPRTRSSTRVAPATADQVETEAP